MQNTSPLRKTLLNSGWLLTTVLCANSLFAQQVMPIRLPEPSAATQAKIDKYIDEIVVPDIALSLDTRQSKLIRTKRPVERFSITHPGRVELVQISPTEFELIGGEPGQTSVTLWFVGADGKSEVLRYMVTVSEGDELDYGDLQKRINEMFPNSYVQLIPIVDKLLVRGQARDAEESAQIMAVIRGQATDQTGDLAGFGGIGGIVQGTAAQRLGQDELEASQVINMMTVAGEQQVMLKVRIAELTRTALRQMGSNLIVDTGSFDWQSILGLQGNQAFNAVLTTEDVVYALQAVSSQGYSKILAEPNLVTLSGQPASFIAGGEFAVPTVVGIDGVGAATTTFRGFGTQLTFIPTVLDKDRIRLFVSPSFSTLNGDATVNGIPGLNNRAVTTTVDLREGQWLAIAGLIQDEQQGSKVGVPIASDIPLLNAIFSRKDIKRDETELIVLVSPELVHPLEPEEAPILLPGMEVNDPNDWDFFVRGRIEGDPNCHHRSTVMHLQRDRVWDANHKAKYEAKQVRRSQRAQKFYIHGKHGFSR